MAESKYGKNLVRKPAYEVSAGKVKGRQNPTMTLMSNDLVPGSNTYLEVGWIWDMPEPNPHILKHSHAKYNEIVLHIGSDPNNPENLGAEIEFTVGAEQIEFDRTTEIFVPAGVTHVPVIRKKVRRP
ncbi:MAG: hypothetical protein MUO97_08575, partial [Dehalococcoidia bacterium]|nr:hypothetical protein [Dehalococcoidia bacterium]